ncbi:MAG: hypothetical protein HC884_10110, partial [Chloroflexaceae bacterium]|nr:hypothetical protein [Chloroflexaceae bacterium]
MSGSFITPRIWSRLILGTLLVLLFTLVPVLAPQAPTAHADTSLFAEDFTNFTGSGFAPAPSAGQLDSDLWRVNGLSDSPTTSFGDTRNTGDFARGSSAGGVTTGGMYAFDVGSGNIVLGVQPGGSDFTPGTITLKLTNTSGSPVTELDIAYDLWYLNDQPRANTLNFSYSTDDSTYTPVAALDFTSPEVSDALGWQSVARATTLSSLNLAPGASFYLQWTGDDATGSLNRDEFGIDAISVSVPSAGSANLVISEIMYNPASTEDNWEWVEVYNDGTASADLSGYVLDDFNTVAHGSANIASGTIPAGSTAVLYNADDVSAANFEAAWGSGINLIAVTDWNAMQLNNTGDQVSLWDSFASYSGDHQAHANAIETANYTTSSPWPASNNSASIYLTDPSADNSIGSNWSLSQASVDGAYQSTAAGGNGGGDVGSPGGVPGGSGDAAPSISSTTPADSATGVAADANLEITFSEDVSVAGNWFQVSCTSSGTRNVADTAVSGGPQTYTINPTSDFDAGENCTVTVYAVQVNDNDTDDPPDNMAADDSFSFTIAGGAVGCGAPATLISAVQGSGSTSPMNGSTVTIEGIVTADYQRAGRLAATLCRKRTPTPMAARLLPRVSLSSTA